MRLDASGKVLERGNARESREFEGKTYLMEKALPGDVAILRAWKVDEAGNCVFRYVYAKKNSLSLRNPMLSGVILT